jgi:hypothetical protein
MQINLPHCLSLHPTAKYATTGKNRRMYAVFVDDREFQVTIKWRGGYFMPHKITHLFAWRSQSFEDSSRHAVEKLRTINDEAALRMHFDGINVW